MSKQRYIDTKFWDDSYVLTLDPSEKLVFLYLLTNPLTAICGIYEIALKRVAFDTGFDQDTVMRILSRFERDGRCIYRNGWIALRNWIKHQSPSDKIRRGIEIQLNEVPAELAEYVSGEIDSQPLASKKRKVSISGAKRAEVLERGNYRCLFCGRSAKETLLEIDHIVPISKGGTDEIDNLRVLCQECNGARNATEYPMGVLSHPNPNPNPNPNINSNTNSNGSGSSRIVKNPVGTEAKECLDYYFQKHVEVRDQKPTIYGKRDMEIFKKLLGNYDVEAVKEILDMFFVESWVSNGKTFSRSNFSTRAFSNSFDTLYGVNKAKAEGRR